MSRKTLVPQARAFRDRLQLATSQTKDLKYLSTWLAENTQDPRDPSRPWSFKDHEFQMQILDDPSPEVDVMKCSQVGLSEVSLRMALASLAILQNTTGIYTLPSSKFASKFTKSRMDPCIEASKTLSSMVPSRGDSTELKRIGRSFLYISGTFGASSAISVPADILFQDEVDFSNLSVLSNYSSRLGHAKGGGIKRRFSTPTVSGYGISEGFERSSKARYHIKHYRCGKWVAPNFLEHVIIPGFNGTLENFDKEDLENPNYLIDSAYLYCPECTNPITLENLCDVAARQWIHEFTNRTRHGYHVVPFDVPSINTVPVTLRSIKDYTRKADWVNFKLGSPYEDAETSFLEEALRRAASVTPVQPESGSAGTVVGIDVGKTSWLTVGRPVGESIATIYAERIKQTGDGYLLRRSLELIRAFGALKVVVDAGPDISFPLSLIDACPPGMVWACEYKKTTAAALSNFKFRAKDQIVEAARTGCLDDLAKKANAGLLLLPVSGFSEHETIHKHLRAMKRVSRESPSTGEKITVWHSTGPDHFAHSLNYMSIAAHMLTVQVAGVVPSVPLAATVKMKEPNGVEKRVG